MKTIHKYEIGVTGFGDHIESIQVPIDAEILSVQAQRGIICAWYLVDEDCPIVRTDHWYQIGTGHRYDGDILNMDNYKGTIVSDEYDRVWHMFVKIDGLPHVCKN